MMPEKLPDIVREYLFFQTRRPVQGKTMRTLKLAMAHPSIPRFCWEDEGRQYSAQFDTIIEKDAVLFKFRFTRNGAPIYFQPIYNSYRRFIVREENICSVC